MTHALYAAGFDVSQLSLGTLTLATSGKTSVVISLPAVAGLCQDGVTTTFKHFHVYDATYLNHFYAQNSRTGLVDTLADWSILTFGRALRIACRAGMTTATWATPSNFDIVFDAATNRFTFSYSATFSLTWSISDGRRLMGFSANSSGAATYTSDQLPYYLLKPTHARVSNPTGNREPGRIATHVAPDNAAHEGYGVSRLRSPLHRKWTQQYETFENCYRLHGLSTAPFTFQDLFEHCRGHFPFILSNGGQTTFVAGSFPSAGPVTVTSEIFMLLNDANSWTAEYAIAANSAQNHVEFRVQVVAMMVWA